MVKIYDGNALVNSQCAWELHSQLHGEYVQYRIQSYSLNTIAIQYIYYPFFFVGFQCQNIYVYCQNKCYFENCLNLLSECWFLLAPAPGDPATVSATSLDSVPQEMPTPQPEGW